MLQAGIKKGVGRVAREGRSDLWMGNGQGIHGYSLEASTF